MASPRSPRDRRSSPASRCSPRTTISPGSPVGHSLALRVDDLRPPRRGWPAPRSWRSPRPSRRAGTWSTVPVASVSPYAVSTVSMPSSDQSRSTSSTGTTAAPVTTSRRVERSYRLAFGMVEDRLEDGRRPGQHRDALLRDPGEQTVDVEDRLGHHGGPGHQTGQDARLVAEGVEERVDDEVAVARAQTDHLATRSRRCAATGRGWSSPPSGARWSPR